MGAKLSSPNAILPYDSQVQELSCYDKSGNFGIPELHKLSKFKVVVTTCMGAGLLRLRGVYEGHFTHFFIDEAGEAIQVRCAARS